jgi:hypothetical protein
MFLAVFDDEKASIDGLFIVRPVFSKQPQNGHFMAIKLPAISKTNTGFSCRETTVPVPQIPQARGHR